MLAIQWRLVRIAIALNFSICFLVSARSKDGDLHTVQGNVTVSFFYVRLEDLLHSHSLLVRAEQNHVECSGRSLSDRFQSLAETDHMCKDEAIVELITAALLSLPKYARDLCIGAAYNIGNRKKSRIKIIEAQQAFNELSRQQPVLKEVFSSFLIERVSGRRRVSFGDSQDSSSEC